MEGRGVSARPGGAGLKQDLGVRLLPRLAGLRAEAFCLTAEVEVDADGGVDFSGVSVEEEWVVASVADGVECCALQHGGAADDVRGFNVAGFGDDGLHDDGASDVGGAGYGWVDGLDGGEEQAGEDSGGDVEWADARGGGAGDGDDGTSCAGGRGAEGIHRAAAGHVDARGVEVGGRVGCGAGAGVEVTDDGSCCW